ncbi:CopG family ribbon-helix-helix protein [Cyanothece sp. BG0011]|uniref:CopG family ribbon-helix-helix protein n=1 Tax=Cyanothece sp. BG0011 TaxID=2082950 RepID=UPI000D1F69AC|nr:ribbon-helix-helix domain-containing protein [Cyanothece sp. BG0011]
MKTAISIPDEVFNKAEELAQKLGISRSELYTQAISNFLQSYPSKTVTDALNEVYSHQESGLDETVAAMQFYSIGSEEW